MSAIDIICQCITICIDSQMSKVIGESRMVHAETARGRDLSLFLVICIFERFVAIWTGNTALSTETTISRMPGRSR